MTNAFQNLIQYRGRKKKTKNQTIMLMKASGRPAVNTIPYFRCGVECDLFCLSPSFIIKIIRVGSIWIQHTSTFVACVTCEPLIVLIACTFMFMFHSLLSNFLSWPFFFFFSKMFMQSTITNRVEQTKSFRIIKILCSKPIQIRYPSIWYVQHSQFQSNIFQNQKQTEIFS